MFLAPHYTSVYKAITCLVSGYLVRVSTLLFTLTYVSIGWITYLIAIHLGFPGLHANKVCLSYFSAEGEVDAPVAVW